MKKARKYIFTVLLFICLALAFFVSVSWGSESQSNGLFEYLSPRPGAEWVSKDGFENVFTYEAPTDGLYYFRVMPVTSTGAETQFSNIMPVFVGGSPVYLPVIMP